MKTSPAAANWPPSCVTRCHEHALVGDGACGLNIVAATDLSAPSQAACERAASLARLHAARLTLVHVAAAPAPGDAPRTEDPAGAQTTADDAPTRLHALAVELQQRHGVCIAEHLEAAISVPDIVVRLAEQLDAGLLVTGTRGGGRRRGVIVGSTAERIARFAGRPVLMVRQPAHEPYRRVLVPIDFSPWSPDTVRLADRMAPQASLWLLHVIDAAAQKGTLLRQLNPLGRARARARERVRTAAQRELAELAAQTGLAPERLHPRVAAGEDTCSVIAEQARAHDCDLIVMGRQGRHALEELMLGSTTSRVLATCSADVLVSVRAAASPPPSSPTR